MYRGFTPPHKRTPDSSMALFQRRIHWLLPTILLVVITFSIWHPGFGHHPPPRPPVEKLKPDEKPAEPPAQEPPKPPPVVETKGWEFDLERDELNFGLSDQQCQVCIHIYLYIHTHIHIQLSTFWVDPHLRQTVFLTVISHRLPSPIYTMSSIVRAIIC